MQHAAALKPSVRRARGMPQPKPLPIRATLPRTQPLRKSGFSSPTVTRPTETEQPLVRPVLTGAVRPRATSGRIAPLIRRSRPPRPEAE